MSGLPKCLQRGAVILKPGFVRCSENHLHVFEKELIQPGSDPADVEIIQAVLRESLKRQFPGAEIIDCD